MALLMGFVHRVVSHDVIANVLIGMAGRAVESGNVWIGTENTILSGSAVNWTGIMFHSTVISSSAHHLLQCRPTLDPPIHEPLRICNKQNNWHMGM